MKILARDKWRVERIEKVCKIVCSMLDFDEAQLAALVYSIDDHNGMLQVFWNHPMTSTQTRAFRTAWMLCGEQETRTEHRVFW